MNKFARLFVNCSVCFVTKFKKAFIAKYKSLGEKRVSFFHPCVYVCVSQSIHL